jgi:hypothetical protein
LPNNVGSVGLGFAKTGFRELLASSVAPQDLRIGARFSGRRAAAVARAIREARRTIADMPVNYTRFPNSDRTVFRVNIGSPPPVREELND